MATTVPIPTGISASGSGTDIWNNILIRQSVLNSDNPNYLRTFQINNNMIVLSRGSLIAGIPLESLIPLFTALVPQLSWPPIITLQPFSQSVTGPVPVLFAVTATSELSPIAYQWQVSSDNGATFNNLTNAGVYSNVTTVSMSVSNVTGLNGYQYRCNVSNASGTTTSNAAILTVT